MWSAMPFLQAALFPVASMITNEWWLATFLICLSPALLILLWVAIALCFLADQPRRRYW